MRGTIFYRLNGGLNSRIRVSYVLPVVFLLCAAWLTVSPARCAERIIEVSNASHNIEDFKQYAELAARLKPYGEVQISISALADKSWYEFPPGGSSWHDYLCYKVAPWKYFPHPKIAPFVPAEHVAANRKLLAAKLKVIRKLGLKASFSGVSSHILPEAFFEAYPEYRGARVDHPRRSTREEFSWCLDQPETREMVTWMVSEIIREAPEVKTWRTKTNDAGSGLCWAAAQYPGPNGPMHCQHLTAGERVRNMNLAELEGARRGGGDMVIIWSSANFWREDEESVQNNLAENVYFRRPGGSARLGMMLGQVYPFRGLFSPIRVISSMAGFKDAANMSLSYTAMYDRADDSPESIAKMLDLAEDCITEPAITEKERKAKLIKFTTLWAGQANSEKVIAAFIEMDEALRQARSAAPRYSPSYNGVSMRHINRPLVIKPELLTAEEESYFLPHVFNPSLNEARMDYIDFHGGRMTGPEAWADSSFWGALVKIRHAGEVFMNLKDAPEGAWLKKLGLSLCMFAGEMRSIHNFYHGQLIRDKYADILNGPKRIPPKVGSWEGEPGNLEWNAIMRNEFDNTIEMIELLKDGGMEVVAHADDPRYEDTFLLGPDLIAQMEKKARIMREHWLDVQDYLAPPHK
ncbi:hypothetical protein ACFLT7_07350 [candidate division KSB1 bacterium]